MSALPPNVNSSTGSSDKKSMSTAVFAALVAVGGLVLVATAFFVTSKVIGSTDPCEQAQQDLIALIDRVGDPAVLDVNPAESRTLTGLGETLRATCTYNTAIDFESTVVFPWLGVDPLAAPAAVAEQ